MTKAENSNIVVKIFNSNSLLDIEGYKVRVKRVKPKKNNGVVYNYVVKLELTRDVQL